MTIKNILKLEGAAIFSLSLLFYYFQGFSWWLFACCFLLPDIGIVGYLLNEKIGAWVYNFFHTETSPILLYALAYFLNIPVLMPVCIIWICHINFDRMLGIGLKETAGFKFTHLGKIGK